MGRPGLSLDKKFRRLAHDLDDFQAGFGRILARGSLELLWDTAYESCTDELGDAFDVEAAAEWRGPSGRLVKALLEAGGAGNTGFIEEGGSSFWPDGAPGTYRVHDLWDHAPEYAHKRAKREEEREQKGKTIKEMRAEAGRKGAAKTNSKRAANGRPPSGKGSANVATLADEPASSVGQPGGQRPADVATAAGTPAPAPAPAQDPPHARVRLVSPFGAADQHPATTAVLAALFERGIDAAPPADRSADRVEAAIVAATLPVAVERLAAVLADPNAKRPLTYHVEAIRGARPAQRGDLGSEFTPWHSRLTPDERREAQGELAALAAQDPDLEGAPLGIVGNPDSPAYAALRALNEKWRAVAEERR